MRAVVFLLLLANLAYAAWHFYTDKSEAQRPAVHEVINGSDGKPLVLLSEFSADMQEQELQDNAIRTLPVSLVPLTETYSR